MVEAALADAPLAPAEYAQYSVLYDEGPCTPTAMARRLGMPLTSVMHVVRPLQRRGHAERLPDTSDRRSYRLALTPAGHAAHATTSAAFAVAERRFDRALT